MRKLKAYGRQVFDSLFCRNVFSKQKIGETDSWYVLTDQLSKNIIYSAGVGKDISFETTLAEYHACTIFLYDPSPTGVRTIENMGDRLPSNIIFTPIGLAAECTTKYFAPPKDSSEGSFTMPIDSTDELVKFTCKSLSDLAKTAGHKYIELLKLDIEGFEYEVIEDVLNSDVDIRQIAVEFHHFFSNISIIKTMKTILLLKRRGYKLIHKRGTDYLFYNPTVKQR